MYDLAIIGGGPAGVAAGVYASRKRLKTVFVTRDWGGQSTVSADVQNWIGTVSISGLDLAQKLEEHLRAYAADVVTIAAGEEVTKITDNKKGGFRVATDQNSYEAKTVLITTGSHRRKLTVPGADRLEHKGITYCASCDGPLFTDLDVAVIGGGNAAFEAAAQLLAYTKSVTLLNRSAEFRADPVTVKKVLAHPKMKAVTNAELVEVKGETSVTGIVFKENGVAKEIVVQGVFAEIGSLPTTEFAASLVELDEYKRIKIDPWTQRTSRKGIWAAGDCTNIKYHQNNIAAGDAVRALEDVYISIHAK
jgi:alkyl hydroperoxide reductase subunit F